MPPALSVLLPIRNAEATLDACLQSLACQTFENFEIVAGNRAGHLARCLLEGGAPRGMTEGLDTWFAS